jgi:hypothetical protein
MVWAAAFPRVPPPRRGLAKFRKGDTAGSDTDISAAKTIQAGIGDNFMRYGVK